MILTDLKIRNFGRHRSIDFSPNANVVGLLGVNGVGKTTILDAIKFALTGETRDEQDSYVLQGENNASVELSFTKGGQRGTIFRQIGKTSKRTLSWDGKTIKAAKEVDELMAALFGADKKAVSSAVFVTQGDLQNVLFGSQVERETLFIRLVNLAFCENISKMISGKIAKVSSTVTDLSVVLDTWRSQVSQANAAWQASTEALRGLSDQSAEITRLTTKSNLLGQEIDIGVLRSRSASSLLDAETHQRNFLKVAGFETSLEISNKLAMLRQVLAGNNRGVEDIRAGMARVEQRARVIQDLEREKCKLTTLAARHNVLAVGVPTDIEEQIGSRQRIIAAAVELLLLKPTIEHLTGEIERNLAEQQALPGQPCTAEAFDALKNAIHSQTMLLEQNRRWLTKQEQLQKCLGKVDAKDRRCKDCGLKIDADQEIDPTAIEHYRSAVKTAEDDIRMKQVELARLTTLMTNRKAAWDALVRSQEFMRAQMEVHRGRLELVKFAEGADVKALTSEVEAFRNSSRDLLHAVSEITATEQTITRLRQEVDCYVNLDTGMFAPQRLQEALNQRISIEASISQTQAILQEANIRDTDVTVARSALDLHDSNLAGIRQRLEQLGETPLEQTLLAEHNASVELIILELQARQQKWSQQEGIVRETTRVRDNCVAGLKDAELRAERDSRKNLCITRLHDLKTLMSRQGLPGRYVAHKFEQLAALTEEHLAKMNAGFTIKIDPEEVLSFRFHRLDDGADLPMCKLSGGQRVRLSLAFLMAVQSALVPDVGLLVLDEPSMHLDPEGKESLAELLADTGRRLSSGDAQVWVSDHAHELEPAFGAVLKL